MKTTEISNSQDIIDSRDIIARIEELRGDLDSLVSDWQDADPVDRDDALEALTDWLGCPSNDFPDDFTGTADELKDYGVIDDAEELRVLEALAEEGSSTSDWTDGETLIRDSYFEQYAKDLAGDLGAINPDAGWPNNCIDWERAARELREDYFEVDFDGVTYWIRA